ncbi:hypothetical protein, partial [Bacillus toyonensis]|uniref:hypothetical protein n=1 Tax=Bacillus toyonensis TaxID=155322 RepID=UPI001C54CF73
MASGQSVMCYLTHRFIQSRVAPSCLQRLPQAWSEHQCEDSPRTTTHAVNSLAILRMLRRLFDQRCHFFRVRFVHRVA